MAYSTPYTFTALELLTAAKMNAIQTNIAAIWAGTTAGDLDYYTSSSAKTRLAIGTAGQNLRVNAGATAPSWVSGAILHAKALYTYSPGGQTHTSTSYIDVTNGSTTIVTTKPCTIFMVAMGMMGLDNNSRTLYVIPMVNANSPADTQAAQVSSSLAGIYPYTVTHYRTGVAAGTITCKVQTKLSAGGSVIGYLGTSGTILLLAFEE